MRTPILGLALSLLVAGCSTASPTRAPGEPTSDADTPAGLSDTAGGEPGDVPTDRATDATGAEDATATRLEDAAAAIADTVPRPSTDTLTVGDLPTPDPDTQAPSPQPLTVLSLNLHCLKTAGTPYATNEARFQAVADLVTDQSVDVLALQEVCKQPAQDALALLKAALGPPWSSTYAFAHTGWAGTPDQAAEGLAILSKTPITAPETLKHVVQGSLTRVSLCADTRGVRVCATHLDHKNATVRELQARELAMAALVDAAPSRDVVITGDLNAQAGTPTHAAFLALGYLDQSADLNPNRIDHLFVHRGASWRQSQASLVFEGAKAVSDHPGLLVTLAPAAAETLTITSITATVGADFTGFLTIRGANAPLSWEKGWPMRALQPGIWRALITEWDAGDTPVKLLQNDTVWQTGDNVEIPAGADQTLTPSF